MTERLQAIVGAKISEFRRKMAQVKAIAKTVPNKIVVDVEARVNKFQQTMNRVSNFIHSLDNVMSNAVGGGMMMVSPAAVPILASAVGLLGSLGPMVGVLGGSTFALATAFGFAGTAALAFGAAAIPTISKLFDESEKLTSAQKAAKKEFTNFQNTWKSITKDLEKPVLQAFGKSMQIANKSLQMARPLFDSAATAVNNLLNSLGKSLDSSPVKAFFDYMNKNAGPMLEKVGKAVGNLMQGFMSMMVAFGPLAEQTAQGFLNMSKGFATWAAGLSKSEKFQAFVNYVNENMPKLKSIFKDAIIGIINTFAAFGPLSADMMTGLQGMMTKFREWSATLAENQQFQQFIGYIRDNAPQVIALIGNLTTFLVNLGIGLAPLGSSILGIVNNFLSWTNSMMETHPWIGKVVGVLLILAGGFRMLVPVIIAAKTLFAGFGTTIMSTVARVLPLINLLKMNLIIGVQMMMQSLGLLMIRVQAVAVSIITSFARMIAQGAVWVARFIAQVAIQLAQWALLGTQALLHAARVAAAWLLTMGKNAAVALARMVATSAVFVAKWAWLGVQALLHAARMAAAWFIALGPVGWVIATVVALVILIIANWDKVKSWTIKIWSFVSDFISKTWQKIVSWSVQAGAKVYTTTKQKFDQAKQAIQTAMDSAKNKVQSILNNIKSLFSSIISSMVSTVRTKFTEIVNAVREKMSETKSKVQDGINQVKSFLSGIDLSSMGRQMIQGLINGIGSMAGALVDKAKGVVSGAIEGAKALLKIKSPSRVFLQIGKFTGQGMINGMDAMNNAVSRASAKMAQAAIIDTQRTQFAFDTGLSGSDFGRIRHDIGAEVSNFENPEPVINVYNDWDGEKVVSYVERGNAKRSRITDGFGGK